MQPLNSNESADSPVLLALPTALNKLRVQSLYTATPVTLLRNELAYRQQRVRIGRDGVIEFISAGSNWPTMSHLRSRVHMFRNVSLPSFIKFNAGPAVHRLARESYLFEDSVVRGTPSVEHKIFKLLRIC